LHSYIPTCIFHLVAFTIFQSNQNTQLTIGVDVVYHALSLYTGKVADLDFLTDFAGHFYDFITYGNVLIRDGLNILSGLRVVFYYDVKDFIGKSTEFFILGYKISLAGKGKDNPLCAILIDMRHYHAFFGLAVSSGCRNFLAFFSKKIYSFF